MPDSFEEHQNDPQLAQWAAQEQSPQLRYYHQFPQKYAHTATLVDLCMEIMYKPCIGYGCDEGSPCPRHQRAPEIAERYCRMKFKVRENEPKKEIQNEFRA